MQQPIMLSCTYTNTHNSGIATVQFKPYWCDWTKTFQKHKTTDQLLGPMLCKEERKGRRGGRNVKKRAHSTEWIISQSDTALLCHSNFPPILVVIGRSSISTAGARATLQYTKNITGTHANKNRVCANEIQYTEPYLRAEHFCSQEQYWSLTGVNWVLK